MENVNLIKKVASNFEQKSNYEFDELFSEAALAYCEAVERYDPDQGAKLSTFAYCHMKNMLINFLKNDQRRKNRFSDQPLENHRIELVDYQPKDFQDIVHSWPKDCRLVVEMIFEHTDNILGDADGIRRTTGTPLQRVKDRLRHRGWKHKRINKAVATIKQELQQI